MNKQKGLLRAEIIIIIVILLAALLPKVIGSTQIIEYGDINNINDFNGKTFALASESLLDNIFMEKCPEAKISYVDNVAKAINDIDSEKVDATLCTLSEVDEILKNNTSLTIFPVPIDSLNYSFAAPNNEQGKEVLKLFDNFILNEHNGTDALYLLFEKWQQKKDLPEIVETLSSEDAYRGTLRIATCPFDNQYCFLEDDKLTGPYTQIINEFCNYEGYKPEFVYVNSPTDLANLSSEDCDFMAFGMLSNDEIKDNFCFSLPVNSEAVFVVFQKSRAAFATTENGIDETIFPGMKVANLLGVNDADLLKARYPEIEIQSLESFPDCFVAVSSGRADAVICFDDQFETIQESFDNLALIFDSSITQGYGFATTKSKKGDELVSKMNVFFNKQRLNGEHNRQVEKWSSGDKNLQVNDEYNYSGENGILKISTGGAWYPFTYYVGDTLSGLFIDMMNSFCSSEGYIPEYTVAPFSSQITGVTCGEYDVLADCITMSKERSESLNITNIIDYTTTKLAIRVPKKESTKTQTVSNASIFLNDIRSSFDRNFITENRWQMLLSGLLITLALSLLSGIIGMILGGIICFMRMSKNNYLSGFARIYIKVIQGTPIVVLLMVLYYVILGKFDISAFLVCIIGFSLDFAAYTCEIYRAGIEAVPKGQRIAARALGFSKTKAFTKVILPQAAIHIVPVFSGQFIALVKTTAVAGYISVQDLTKVSDIIRSRTFEAFFPLISTAIIYFLISTLLVLVLRRVERRINPRLRPRVIKGVKTDAN